MPLPGLIVQRQQQLGATHEPPSALCVDAVRHAIRQIFAMPGPVEYDCANTPRTIPHLPHAIAALELLTGGSS